MIEMTENAAKRISETRTSPEEVLRLAVDGGGCSGFQYTFTMTVNVEDTDLVVERSGAKLVVDDISLALLEGSVIDYVDSLMGASFTVSNPLAKASCGCGTSFTI
jgi:iron-sulfur cluster assembly accessory protein